MLDNLDIQILNIIQSNARVSQADVARAVGLAPSAVLERLRKLEAKGVLTGYAALLDPEAIGLGQLAFVAVRTAGALDLTDKAGELLAEVPGVLEVHHLAGEDCYLVKLRGRDAQHVGQLLRLMKVIPSVTSTRTTMVLSTVKDTPRMPLPAIAVAGDKADQKKDALLEREPVGKEPVGKDPVGKDPVGKDPIGKDAVEKNAVEKDAASEEDDTPRKERTA